MSRSAKTLLLAALAVLAVTQGCGGSAPYEKGPSAPSGAPEKGGSSPASADQTAAPASAPPAPALEPLAQSRVPPVEGRAATRKRAESDLEVAQRELDVSASDCRAACRALGSMDRAAGHLCDLARAGDEREQCEEAKIKLFSARDRVRTTCGACPGGASVERAAPVPSVP